MSHIGLGAGDEVVVTVRLNKEILLDVVLHVISANMVESKMYVDQEDKLVVAKEALAATLSTVDYRLELPHLRGMVQKRINELRALADEEEGEPPYPIDEGDIPF